MTAKLLDKVEFPLDRYAMRLSGSGGQGMIFASVIIAEAIGSGSDKRNVVQTQSYGPEARGGASKADVVISENEIYYPKAMDLDFLLVMTHSAMLKNSSHPEPGKPQVILALVQCRINDILDTRHYLQSGQRLPAQIHLKGVLVFFACRLTETVSRAPPLGTETDKIKLFPEDVAGPEADCALEECPTVLRITGSQEWHPPLAQRATD